MDRMARNTRTIQSALTATTIAARLTNCCQRRFHRTSA